MKIIINFLGFTFRIRLPCCISIVLWSRRGILARCFPSITTLGLCFLRLFFGSDGVAFRSYLPLPVYNVYLGMFRASSRVLKFVRCRNGISMILLKSTSLSLRPTLVGFLEDMSTDNICRWKVVPLMEVSQLLQLRSKDLQREAKVWNCVLEKAEKMAGIEKGSIRDIVLIQTLPVALQMDEILYDLRDHSVGLNCGKHGEQGILQAWSVRTPKILRYAVKFK
ncbi:uncharacterized protein LOC113341918 isoform X3 [Papaver somniferum]|uniref:uncharacterized protein LOC113341918 isoform X3 n=1 Tax=Papaver somniferum TaxID=3469 RepID=UPI000E6FF1A3|nr:uncharacterized protein LOC113341918 isoform X3 [Papaver somniferum]XP_026442413.1 uncharacterized protein LOC113341918 isoform X3 [Papaver somniferum]XP_026442414.1 uncharacterized protein LOC113341918 isoform X3 [Papaver somniferum]